MAHTADSILNDKKYAAAVRVGLNGNPYLPEYEQKAETQRILDNLYWLVQYGEVNHFYYCYQLDRVGLDVRKAKNCIPYTQFRSVRGKANSSRENAAQEIATLQDKVLFSSFCSSQDIPGPQQIALVENERIKWADKHREPVALVDIRHEDVTAFCKPVDGIMGKGAFHLRVSGGRIYVDDVERTVADLRALISGRYLMQKRIVQHKALAVLHPTSVNTVRIITSRDDNGAITPLAACLRIGAGGGGVDNWAAGGIIIKVDLSSGRLTGSGYFKPGKGGGRVLSHPDTGIVFDGYQIPYFAEAVSLCIQAHSRFRLHSIGWDIAYLEDGPLLIEGNDNWDGAIPMTLDRNFASRFMASISSSNRVEGTLRPGNFS